ncbi:MAG TPA: HNH endonuclease signature motif containing protein [Solirubrobacterales bacterium]
MSATPRRGPLHVGQPKAPDSPQGVCRWCGDPIQLVDPSDYRRARRRYHYGDEHEVGETDCLNRWKASAQWDAHSAVRLREMEAHGKLFCAECGLVVYEPPEPGDLYREIRWECDHRIPLEDGGPHHIDNLQVLCVEDHRKKTAREASARAERRRLSRRPQLAVAA